MAGRAGLVGTQNIRNNQSRVGGLDHVVKTGTIVEAVENQPWSGEANVHVSIANWVKTQDAALLPKSAQALVQSRTIRRCKETPQARQRPGELRNTNWISENANFINSALSDQTDVAWLRKC